MRYNTDIFRYDTFSYRYLFLVNETPISGMGEHN